MQASPSATKVFGDTTTAALAEPSAAKVKAINDQTMAWIQSEAKREAQKFAEKHRVKSAEKSLQEAETAAASGAEVTLFKEDSEQTVGLSNQTMALIKDMAKKDLEKSDEVKPVSNVVSETEEDLTEEDQKRETEVSGAEESFASIESEGEKSDDQSVGLGEQTLAEIRFSSLF